MFSNTQIYTIKKTVCIDYLKINKRSRYIVLKDKFNYMFYKQLSYFLPIYKS